MGNIFSFLRLQEPMWFSYYGPINQTEVSEALDAIITSHLQEIGSSASEIPIRHEKVEEINVPVALDNPPFAIKGNDLFLSFSTTEEGKLIIYNNKESESFDFGIGLDQKYCIKKDYGDDYFIKFEFNNEKGVNSRIYTIAKHNKALPVVKADNIEIDGVISTVSKVYNEQNDNNDVFANNLCIICCTEPASVISYPCRHFCMCSECCKHFSTISNKCPVCRSVIRELINCSDT